MKRQRISPSGPTTLEARPGSVHRIPPDHTSSVPVHTVRSDLPLGTVIAAGAVALLVMVAVVVAVQNSDSVQLDLLWWAVDVPLAVLLVVAVVVGAVVASAAAAFLRRRRRNLTAAPRSAR